MNMLGVVHPVASEVSPFIYTTLVTIVYGVNVNYPKDYSVCEKVNYLLKNPHPGLA